MSTPKVHCFSGSPFVWRALLTLDEKGIEHERNWVPRMSGEHKTEKMLALNPRGRFPILEWGDVVLYESAAIVRFLDLEVPDPPLLPKETAARAATLVRSAEVDTYLLSAVFPTLEMGMMRPADDPIPDAQREANRRAWDELDAWERRLAEEDTEYVAGDSFTMADVLLFPLIAFSVRCKLALAERAPALHAWYERIAERPSVTSSWPPHWRESEGRDIGLNAL